VAVLTLPLHGGPSRGEMALRGKPGDKGRCGFLGGARSARPDGKARTSAEAFHFHNMG